MTTAAPTTFLGLLLGFLLIAPSSATMEAPLPQDDVASLVAEITSKRDEVEPEKIAALGDLKSKEAADALVSLYDKMSSLYMQREILRALVKMDGVGGAQGAALQRMMDSATSAKAPELRQAALTCLSQCPTAGKDYLKRIVDSIAENATREAAMELHTANPDASDHAWYRELFENPVTEGPKDKKKKKKKGRKDKDAEPEKVVYSLPRVRELAFRTIASEYEERDLLTRFEEESSGALRVAMLEELARRGSTDTADLGWAVVDDINMPSSLRCAAVRVLAGLEGSKVSKRFIKLAQKQITPVDVRLALAEALADMRDEDVDKATNKLIAKGKSHEKLFALLATRYQTDEKTLKKVRKGLKDKDDAVRNLTIAQLGERKDAEAVEDLRKLISKKADEALLTYVLEAMSKIEEGNDAWLTELVGYASNDWNDVRNAAVRELGRLNRPEHGDLLVEALSHPNWSTRLAALRGLEARRSTDVLGPIIARMQEEEGRLLHEFADTLWRLTGQPFRLRATAWKGWFEKEGADAELISAAELAKRAQEEEDRRLKQISRAEFFGIRIRSKRVVFIIDVSGSMSESLRSEYVGRQGEPRIDRAKKELKRAVEDLEEGALFNIITFSTVVGPWLKEGVAEADGKSRDEAIAWIDLLGAAGATNLHDAIELAFQDLEADTILILSDGEPTMGAVLDPAGIREAVRRWNRNRGVEIHCIALGGSLQILEWLAADHGGRYTRHD